MKRLKLWLLVAVVAIGSLVGCSRASTKSRDASDHTRKLFDQSGRELGVSREEVRAETTKNKPSACIKWAKGSGRRSTLRRAIKTAADPQAVPENREKNLQAANDNYQH